MSGSGWKLGNGIKGLERSVTGCIQLGLKAAYLRSSLSGLTALFRGCVEEEDGHLLGLKACSRINAPLSPELFAVLTHEDVIKKIMVAN